MSVDLGRVKQNIQLMLSKGATDQDLEDYASQEGTTADAIRGYQVSPLDSLKYQTLHAVKSGAEAVGTGMKDAFVAYPAAVRQRMRVLGQTGDINQANTAADAAYKNPALSPMFQDEGIKGAQEVIDKSPALSNVANMTDQIIPKMTENLAGPIPAQLINSLVKQGGVSPSKFAMSLPASAVGMAADVATNPAEIGAMVATDGALRGIGRIPVKGLTLAERAENLPIGQFLASSEGQAGKAAKAAIAARDAVVKGLPLTGTLESNRTAGEAASKYIQPAKNAEELSNQLELAQGINAGEMRNRLKGGVLSEERSQHDPILGFIEEYKNSAEGKTKTGQANIRKLQDLQTADVEHLNSQDPATLNDPEFYQKQKQDFQAKAEDLGAYKNDPSNTILSKGYKKMAQGYRQKLENLGPDIAPINQEGGGLADSFDAARKLATEEAGAPAPSLGKEAASALAPEGKIAAIRMLRKSIPERLLGSPVKGMTRKVSGLMDKSEKAQQLADLIESVKANRTDTGELVPPLALPAPTPQQLTFDLAGKMKRGELLPGPTGSGPTIPVQGSSTINMGADAAYPKTANLPAVQYPGLQPVQPPVINLPEIPDSVKAARLQELMQSMGVPQYGNNPRVSIAEALIPKTSAPAPQEGLIMSIGRRKMVEALLKRREQNLG